MQSRLDVPVGTILDYAGSSVPDGYLECDGSAVSRTAYPKLFAAIGTLWGAGDGSTTFNLPDLGGRVGIGKGSRSVGNTGGSETHTLTTAEIPNHGHGFTQPKVTLGSHNHGTWVGGTSFVHHASSSAATSGNVTFYRNPGGTNTASTWMVLNSSTGSKDLGTKTCTGGAVSNSTGGGGAHSSMQPYAVVRKVIRAA